jgi:YgiT-type zinc finger domain-containing protein
MLTDFRTEVPGARVEERCACGGRLEPRVIHRYRVQDDLGHEVEAHNVPARVCRRCGDVLVDPAVVRAIEAEVASQFFPPRHVDYAVLARRGRAAVSLGA